MSRVLVVDDDRSAASGLETLLQLDGYEVIATGSPREAIERLRSEAFDAVVTDLEMPAVHGVEVVRAARESSATMPVLAMTGYFGSAVCDAATRAGARRVFGKPVDYDDLAAELADALRR